jgi:hypothetical protein
MRALAHPVRMALVELLAVLDTVTATQASELLGESPANCAFHLRTLARYGFVEEAGGGRGRQRPWKAADLHLSVSSAQDDPRAAMAATALNRMWFEQWVERARPMFTPGTTPRDPHPAVRTAQGRSVAAATGRAAGGVVAVLRARDRAGRAGRRAGPRRRPRARRLAAGASRHNPPPSGRPTLWPAKRTRGRSLSCTPA